jgi:hypothetical protein
MGLPARLCGLTPTPLIDRLAHRLTDSRLKPSDERHVEPEPVAALRLEKASDFLGFPK